MLAHLLPIGAAICGSPATMAGGLFLTALLGSFAHCMPMCGPFVLMQSAGRFEGPLLHRAAGALLLHYQAGRLITYVGLGAVAGGMGDLVSGQGALRWPIGLLLGAAALAFLAQAVNQAVVLPAGPLAALVRPLADFVVPLAARCPGGFRLGLLLGLLPCGFLYAALTVAAASGSLQNGALAMAAFGAGTAPGLIVVGLTGRIAAKRWKRVAGHGLTALFLLNGLSLAAAALSVF